MSHQVITAPSVEETAAKINEMVHEEDVKASQDSSIDDSEVDSSKEESTEVEVESQDSSEGSDKEEVETHELDEALSQRFAKIAEREREFRQVEQKLSEQEERINSRLAELESREKKLSNPDHLLEVLEGLNMTPDEFQKRMLLGQIQLEKPEVDPVQQKLQELEERTLQVEEMRQEILKQREQQELEKLENQYLSRVKDAATRYENLGEYFDGDMDEIVKVAYQQAELYAAQHNEAPEVDELLGQLDAYYGSHLDRLRKKLQPKDVVVESKEEKKKPFKTLKGSDTQTASTTDAGGLTAMDVATGKITMDQWSEYVLKKQNFKG